MKEFPFDWVGAARRWPVIARLLDRLGRFRSRLADRAVRPAVAELEDLKNLTERALRRIASRVVGPDAGPLETRAQLIAAIRAALRRRGGEAAQAAAAGASAEAGSADAWRTGKGRPDLAAEPRPEGHLIARVRGEEEAHAGPHPLTEDRLAEPTDVATEIEERVAAAPSAPVDDEGLGELPASYGDDALVALPRDPTTLWCYWDFSQQTVQEAMAGLENPHAKMRVLEQGRLVREIDFALESRSFYVNDLTPGRHYRVELFFYGTNGVQKRIGRPSNSVGLPPKGPSPILDDRFVTLVWGMPLARRHDLFARARPEGGFSGEERDAFHAASVGRGGASSEYRGGGAPGDATPGGGRLSARFRPGTRNEGA